MAYRSFTIDELKRLKGLGISEPMLKAMIESDVRAVREKRDEDERKALRNEIEALKKLVAQQGAANGARPTGETADGSMDAALCMSKRLAAMTLCEQTPWPASTVCSSAAEADFSCK